MNRRILSPFPSPQLREASPPTAGRGEHEANRAAQHVLDPTAGRPDPGRIPPSGRPLPAGLVPSGGQPLAEEARRPLEGRFGRDFSHVRVHHNPQAAADVSARAYTVGNHIVGSASALNPSSVSGLDTLAHELAHTLQQGGEPSALQRQDGPPQTGIGASPPDVPFTVVEGVGEENHFVLFEPNSAELTSTAQQQIARQLTGRSGPQTVRVHGYASSEGNPTYNTNLSAHRAAAVRSVLLPLLPEGSVVELVAHGETTHFGELPANRRAGVQITPGVSDQAAADAGGQGIGLLNPNRFSRIRLLPGDLHLNLDQRPPIDLSVPQPLAPAIDPRFFQPTPAPPTIDWPSVTQPFHIRSVPLNPRDITAIGANWSLTFNSMRRLGLSDSMAAWVANQGTAHWYESVLTNESPTTWDSFQREHQIFMLQNFPGEFHTPIVPLITPGTLNSITRWMFHQDINFEF